MGNVPELSMCLPQGLLGSQGPFQLSELGRPSLNVQSSLQKDVCITAGAA